MSSNYRIGKGESMTTVPENYTIIDIETTGLDPRYDDILEVCAIRYVQGEEAAHYSTLIRPETNNYIIPNHIKKLTGIDEDLLDSQGIPLKEALTGFLNFIEDDIVIGHNVNFDINFIYDSARENIGKVFSNDFVDTLRLSRAILRNLEKHRLADLKTHFNISSNVSHRAYDDCSTTHKILLNLIAIAKTNDFSDLFRKKNYKKLKYADFTTEHENINEDNPFFNQHVVFTGKLDSITRKDAMQTVVNLGAIPQDTVTKKTNIVVLGDTVYSVNVKDGATTKQKKAQNLIESGQDLIIITESVFSDMLD